jgi:hypothetical protein
MPQWSRILAINQHRKMVYGNSARCIAGLVAALACRLQAKGIVRLSGEKPARMLDSTICQGVTSMLAAYLLLSSGLFVIVSLALAVAVRPEGADSIS